MTFSLAGQDIVQASGRSLVESIIDLFNRMTSVLLARPALFALVVLHALAYLGLRHWNNPWRKLPPGPTGYPVIGSARKLVGMHWLFTECPKYGDVVYLNVAGQPTLVLNTQKAAAELLDRRAATYSGRPRFIVRNQFMCGGMFIPFETHNDRWRRQRRIVHEGFNKSAASRFHEAEAEEAVRLGAALLEDPLNFRKHYHAYVASVVLSITYDRPLRGGALDKALLSGVKTFIRRSQKLAWVGGYVDLMPWLAYLPACLAKWKPEALSVYIDTTAFFLGLMEDVEGRMKQETVRPCLAATLLEGLERFHVSRLEAAWSAGIMYAVGSETTSHVLEWWTLAMLTSPDAQKRAQAELDAIIGRERPPSLADQPHLPYIVAVVRETLRWRTVTPLGVPHIADADDYYEGMFIPKGSVLVANMLPCNRDPAVYGGDGHLFRPERHLDDRGRLMPAPPTTKEHGHVSFGFGRRICVGMHVAEDTLFIAIAMLLWAFQFSKARNEDGQEIDVDVEGFTMAGLSIRANEAKCTITPRFPAASAMLTEGHNHE
ncbi:cytochrome P450 [Peniophora sp. CONT]|nr:cytochrome P450 [Peniophora sp. CONT]